MGLRVPSSSYLHVEGEVACLGLLQVTLGVLEPHLEAVGLGLHLTQLRLLPLGLHLLLYSREEGVMHRGKCSTQEIVLINNIFEMVECILLSSLFCCLSITRVACVSYVLFL